MNTPASGDGTDATVSRIPARLRQARLDAGLTTSEVANAIRISPEDVSKIEMGASRASGFRLGQFADIYGVTVWWLLTGEQDPPSPSDDEPADA